MKYENVFYFKKVNSIGGVETFIYNLSCLYKNFVFFYKEGNIEQIKRLSKNIEVIKYMNQKIKCKRFFCNYSPDIIDNVEAEEYIFLIHCDYTKVNFAPPMNSKFTKFIGVSKLACDSFKKITGVDAELIYNPVVVNKHNVPKLTDKIHLISATRLTKEKGGSRINKLAKALDNAGIDYVWDIYTNKQYRWDSKNIVWKQPKLDLSKEIEESTYLVQLSDHESFGLSVAESLCLGTPVIITDLPAFKEIGCKHGKNAIVCNLDMSNINIPMIQKRALKVKYMPLKSEWSKYLDNNTNYNPDDRIKVRVIKRLYDKEENKHYRYGDEPFMKKWRVSELECQDIVERLN
jgi:glycosyltransferase involved in cell wall biosynthesis